MTELVARRKTTEVQSRIARVRELLPASLDTFLANRTEQEALILNLYLSIQGCADLALHVVALRDLGVPAEARGAFERLGTAGIVNPELARRLAAAVGMRNRIAHEYGNLDLTLIYQAAGSSLQDLESFAATIRSLYAGATTTSR